MVAPDDPAQVYRAINVRPIISASGSTTRYGGTKTRPEVLAAMSKATRVMVNIDELNREAGKVIADITGAEAGFVSSGAAGEANNPATATGASPPEEIAEESSSRWYDGEQISAPSAHRQPTSTTEGET